MEAAAITRPTRAYFCRTCGAAKTSEGIPTGWYAIKRFIGAEFQPHGLGLFCSAKCMAEQMPRLQGIEDDMGSAWVENAYRA